MSSESPRSRQRLWLVALIAFAALVRLTGVEWDNQHFYHPDERAIASAVDRLSFSPLQLNPQFFAYGSFPFYVIRAANSLVAQVDRSYGSYVSVINTGRVVSALIGILTVVLLYRLGTRLYGWRVGLAAAFLLAACPLHVQNSHYGTTDVFLTFLVLLTLSNLVAVVQHGRTRDYLGAGIALGLSVATKFSALPLLAPLGVAVLVRLVYERRAYPIAGLLLAILAAALAFSIGQPYALLDFAKYSHDIEEQSRMVRNAGMFPYTNQYVGTPKYFYELKQMILWGMAPPLGIAALLGTGACIWNTVRERSRADLVLLSYVLPFFLVTGWFEVKFPRYLLPIYPVLILWAAALLVRLAQRSRLARPLLWGTLVTTGLAAVALLSIYMRPHTAVSASEWVYAHIPSGSVILTQHWDEGFPFSFPGNRNVRRYTIVEMPYYEPDTPAKIRKIAQELARADYIAFQTKRLYGALTQAANKYPLSNNYFYLLFAGDLGYQVVHEEASRPSLFGIEFHDELADESLTVYDHPKVLILQKKEELSADVIFEKIMRGIPSRQLTRDDLLLAAPGDESRSGASVAAPIRSSWEALLWFIALAETLGLCAYAIVRRWLPVPGVYAAAKVIGVLLLVYPPFAASGLGVGFTRGTMALNFALLAAAALLLARRGNWRTPRTEILTTELLFWGTFALFLTVRAFNPEVYWGEKPMDFAFLNALTRTTDLPPPEPWFSGSLLHYTYFGHYIVAALGKLINIHPGITFNLGIAFFGALTAAAAFAAGCAASRRWPVGLLTAFFVVLTGNLAGVREAIQRRSLNFDYFWATSRVIKDTINEYPLWSYLFADLHAHVLVMPFSLLFLALALWFAQRHEIRVPTLPAFSILALLLGTIMVTNGWSSPTYVLFFPFLLAMIQFGTNGGGRPRRWLVFFCLALIVAPAVALHLGAPPQIDELLRGWGWESPPRDLFLRIALGGAALTAFALMPVLFGIAAATLLLVATAYALYLPFWSHFNGPGAQWGFENQSFANFYDFGNIFGVFLCAAIPFLFVLWRQRLVRGSGASVGMLRGSLMWIFALTVGACFVLSIPQINEHLPRTLSLGGARTVTLGGSLRIGLAALAILALNVSLQTALSWPRRLAAILFTFAFSITAGTDIVYVWDRMNTIFKFYLESWFLFSIAGAVAAAELWKGAIRTRPLRFVWKSAFVTAIAVSLFTGATAIYGAFNTQRVQTPRPTLDGTAYLEARNAHEKAAFEWLNENVRGIPVIAEAHGPSYQEFTRVSMNTGLPTVLGWDYHVHQRSQRWPDIRRRKADLTTLYTSDQEKQVRDILRHYNIALVYVGGLERRTHAGANLNNFKKWTDLMTPVYQNRDVTIFAVNGQFTGAMPITTIEEVPQVAEDEEIAEQATEGRLRQPRGIALGPTGEVYVADFGNDRIQVFDADFNYLRGWGERGELPGQLKQASAVAIGPDGEVYVADTWNQRIQVFNAEGEYVREWGGAFFGPRGIAVAPTGEIFLADTGNHKVRKFNREGVEIAAWGSLGSDPGQFKEPVGLAVDAQGKVYVTDNGNARVQIFDGDGKLVKMFSVPGFEMKVFSEPNITVTPDGTIWVTVPAQRIIRAYSPDGEQLAEHVGQEKGARFGRPMGLAYDQVHQNLVVSDLENQLFRLETTTP